VADDLVQAAILLRKEPGVEHVGFFGFSNGGWVAPAAAVRYRDPAFVIIKSGDSGSVEENVLYETATAAARSGGPSAARLARSAMAALFTALHSDLDRDWAAARASLVPIESAPWRAATQLPPPQALPLPDAVKEGYRRQLFFDPRQDLLALRCPVLVLLGDADLDVDGPASAARYRDYFAQSGNKQAEVMLFAGAGHQLVAGPGPAANSSLATGRYVEGFPGVMTAWLHRHIRTDGVLFPPADKP
jgi:pimeloyl-ACP methyl ester carboxylesterase